MILAVLQAVVLVGGTVTLFVLQRGQDRCLAVTFLLFTATIVTNVDPVYRWLDPLLGGVNVVTLVGDCLMVAGTSTLLWGVAKAVGSAPRWLRTSITVAFLVVLAVVVVAFTVLEKPPTTTTFMLDAGAAPAAAVYSIAQTTYLGVALGATGTICVLRFREARGPVDRVGLAVLVLGGVAGLVRTPVVVVMDVAHVRGDLGTTHALAPAYDVTTPTAVLCVAGGMLLLVIGHQVRRARRARAVRRALRRLRPVHERVGTDNAYPASDDPATRLTRIIVEINDGLRASRSTLSASERGALVDAERALDTV